MNAIIQAFLNQLIGFSLIAFTYVCSYYQEKAEYRKQGSLYLRHNMINFILFIIIWFGPGTYFTWKFNYGVFA